MTFFYHVRELDQSLAKFFLKDHTVNISALLAILASVTTTQLCCCSTKEASNDK